MKLLNKKLVFLSLVMYLVTGLSFSCKSKTNDAAIQKTAESALASNNDLKGLTVDVKDGVVILTGEVKDEAHRTAAQNAVAGVEGVRKVENNIMVAAPPPAPVEITKDDSLVMGIRDATKDFPSVTATVEEGVIFVKGEIKSADWKRLKMALDGLRPKRVDAKGLKVI